jgi:hypothetical protein
MKTQLNGTQGRDSVVTTEVVILSAEGANLEQAKPGETLRQKDPASA